MESADEESATGGSSASVGGRRRWGADDDRRSSFPRARSPNTPSRTQSGAQPHQYHYRMIGSGVLAVLILCFVLGVMWAGRGRVAGGAGMAGLAAARSNAGGDAGMDVTIEDDAAVMRVGDSEGASNRRGDRSNEQDAPAPCVCPPAEPCPGAATAPAPETPNDAPTATGSTSRLNVVMGTASGSFPHLSNLLRSVARVSKDIAVVLALDTTTAAVARPELQSLGLRYRVYSFNGLSSYLPASMGTFGINVKRYHHYAEMIRDLSLRGTYIPEHVLYEDWRGEDLRTPDAVLLTDMRDVVLQADPFVELWRRVDAAAPSESNTSAPSTIAGPVGPRNKRMLVVAQEKASMTIGACPYNSGWINTCYGEQGLNVLRNHHIWCSGTTLGTFDAIYMYLLEGMVPIIPLCTQGGGAAVDQGVHNFVLQYATNPSDYSGAADTVPLGIAARTGKYLSQNMEIVISEAESDWLCTVGYFPQNDPPSLDADGWVRSRSDPNKRCAVVHQYDRFPSLTNHFNGKF